MNIFSICQRVFGPFQLLQNIYISIFTLCLIKIEKNIIGEEQGKTADLFVGAPCVWYKGWKMKKNKIRVKLLKKLINFQNSFAHDQRLSYNVTLTHHLQKLNLIRNIEIFIPSNIICFRH